MPRWLARGNWVWTVMLATLALASTADAADAKKTIVIWDYNEYRDWVLEEFTTTTGIHADYQFVDAGDPMMVRIVAGEVPDVIRVDKQDIGQYIFKDLVADLSAFAARDNFPYRDVVGLENVMWRGTLIGTMPLANTNAINFNEDMFLASGLETPDSLQRRDQWTWDNFLRAAKKLTVDNDGDGVFERRGYYFDVGYYASFFNWTWSNGGDAFHPDTLACQLGQDPVREALEFAASLVLEHRVVSSPGLGAGKVAMEDGWTGPQPNNEAIKFITHPRGPRTEARGYSMLLTSSPFVVYSRSAKKELAWEFIKFVTRPDVQIRGILLESGLEAPKPLRISMLPAALKESARIAPAYNWNRFFDAQENFGRALPKIVNMRGIIRDIGKEMRAVMAGQQPVRSFVAKSEERYTRIARGELLP